MTAAVRRDGVLPPLAGVRNQHIEQITEETNVLDHGAGSAISGKGLFSLIGRVLRLPPGVGRTRLKDETHLQRGESASELKPDLHQAALISVVDKSHAVVDGEGHHSTAVTGTTACISKIELEAAVETICDGLGSLSAGSFEPLSPLVFNVQFNPQVHSFNQFGRHLQVSFGEIHQTSEGVTRGLRTIDHANKEVADRSNRIAETLDDGHRPFQKVRIFGGAIDCEVQTLKLIAFGTSVASKVAQVHADQAERSVISIQNYAGRINTLVEFVQSAQASFVDDTSGTGRSSCDGREHSGNPAVVAPSQICDAVNDIQELAARIATETAKCHKAMMKLSAFHLEIAHSTESLRDRSHAIVAHANHLDQAVEELSGHMRKAHHESQRLQSACCPISTQVDNLTLATIAQRDILSKLGAKGRSDFAARREVSPFVTPSTSGDERVVMFPTRDRRSERS
ncbi:MAG: hypothetical protein JWL86_5932 [Rhizobium sp.]|nr:hypothetical protein [Rhizobium sp.]